MRSIEEMQAAIVEVQRAYGCGVDYSGGQDMTAIAFVGDVAETIIEALQASIDSRRHITRLELGDGSTEYLPREPFKKVVALPCELGDTVYMAYEGNIEVLTVNEIRHTHFGLIVVAKDNSGGGTWSFAEECIGRTAFFDHAQAAAAKEAQRAADNR